MAAIRSDWSDIATTPSPLEAVENEKKRQIQAANEHRAQKEKRIEDLKSAFHKERRQRISEIMASWDKETLSAELADFEKTTDSVTRNRCRKSGLDSRLVKAAFDQYVAKKYLSSAENNLVIWASQPGYEVEGRSSGGYQVRPVRFMFHTIQINSNALSAHLNHGDLSGACSENCDAVCDDGNACTQDVEVCDPNTDTVVCLADHPPVNCDDSNACSTDSCDPVDGCVYDFLDCTDADLCTVDECNPATGVCEYTDIVCDPEKLCDIDTGECVIPLQCDPNPCLNGGTCYPGSDIFDFICNCEPGWTGDLCEIPDGPI